eukprot:1196013-Prorocentrum_minimum.AAC.8
MITSDNKRVLRRLDHYCDVLQFNSAKATRFTERVRSTHSSMCFIGRVQDLLINVPVPPPPLRCRRCLSGDGWIPHQDLAVVASAVQLLQSWVECAAPSVSEMPL